MFSYTLGTYSHGELDINYSDTSGTNKALRLASKSDVVVVVMGEHGLQSGEGRSRAKINLPGIQESFLKEIYKANNKVILVLMNGRPLDLSWVDENIPAVVEAWQLGTMSGEPYHQFCSEIIILLVNFLFHFRDL